MLVSREAKIRAILIRQRPVEALSSLISALSAGDVDIDLNRTAIVFDASVFLRVATHRRAADIVDYLSAQHKAPLVIPGQAIQEFWNNQLNVVDTMAASLSKKFEDLRKELERVDSLGGAVLDRIRTDIESLRADYGHVYDEGTKARTLSLMDMLRQHAIVPFADRIKFEDVAAARKTTRTPPGFKDAGNGDFYTWLDMLTGLSQPTVAGKFDTVAFVTHDVKIDWSRAGLPHPLLAVEVREILKADFVIWSIDKLVSKIDAAT